MYKIMCTMCSKVKSFIILLVVFSPQVIFGDANSSTNITVRADTVNENMIIKSFVSKNKFICML